VAASVTIRVTPETRDLLNRLSAERGVSTGELVEELATHAEDRALLEATVQHYADLRSDPKTWSEYHAEISAWDVTNGDGLSGE
jgi:Ribbon-helix-helix protein, copG family